MLQKSNIIHNETELAEWLDYQYVRSIPRNGVRFNPIDDNTEKPKSYPCIAIYHLYEDYNRADRIDYEFVYQEDFNPPL